MSSGKLGRAAGFVFMLAAFLGGVVAVSADASDVSGTPDTVAVQYVAQRDLGWE